MKRLLLIAFVLAGILALPATAHASWVSDHCFQDRHGVTSLKRSEAKGYASVAAAEGYEYAGGCWNDNNKDDTPGAPDSDGEGPDCSGLVFKSWGLKPEWGQGGINWYSRFDPIHGPYSSYTFHSAPDGVPFFNLPDKKRSTTIYMDAFAKNGHVALLWSNTPTSDNLDQFIEAKGDAYGTNVFTENYRYDGDYKAARRKGWTADCAPQCQRVDRQDGVVLIP